MSQVFSQYIKIIGKGKKGSRSLTEAEAYDAMVMLLNNVITQDQRGAFLMLLRTREETPEEVIGFVRACRERLNDHQFALPATLDIGCYAGKRRQLPWYLLAVAALVKVKSVPVFLHGAEEPGSGRLYASHVLPALGLPATVSKDDALAQFAKCNVTYLDLGQILPELNTLIKLREVFGLRSCANTLARLLNPSAATYSVQGVYHTHLDHKHAHVNEAFADYQALVFRGDGGDPEVNSERPTELLLTRDQKTESVMLPEMAESWALKDKALDVDDMLGVWRGDMQHGYGEQAVHATLTAYLMLLNGSNVEQARAAATDCWNQRPKTVLPFA